MGSYIINSARNLSEFKFLLFRILHNILFVQCVYRWAIAFCNSFSCGIFTYIQPTLITPTTEVAFSIKRHVLTVQLIAKTFSFNTTWGCWCKGWSDVTDLLASRGLACVVKSINRLAFSSARLSWIPSSWRTIIFVQCYSSKCDVSPIAPPYFLLSNRFGIIFMIIWSIHVYFSRSLLLLIFFTTFVISCF